MSISKANLIKVNMKLTEEIKETIQQTPDLYAKVCNELGKAPATLYQILKKDDNRLLQLNVINAIKDFTGLTESEILEDSKITA